MSSKRLAPLLVAAFALLFVCCNNPTDGSQKESTFQKIIRQKRMDVGYVIYSPIIKKDPNSGDLSGHFVDAIRYIGNEMGVEVVFHEFDWATFSAGLQSKKCDVSIAPTYSTISRSLSVSFTSPIIYMGSSAVIRKSDSGRFKNLSDLNNKNINIAVVQGEGNHEYAKREFVNANLKVLTTSNMILPVVEVVSKNADVALTDMYTAKQYVANNKDVVLMSQEPFNILPIGWAVRSDDQELLNFLNNAIQYLEDTRKMKEWEDKYNAHWLKRKVEYKTN